MPGLNSPFSYFIYYCFHPPQSRTTLPARKSVADRPRSDYGRAQDTLARATRWAMRRQLCWLIVIRVAGLAPKTDGAEGPFPEKIDLFEANTGGYAHYRIPGLVVTTQGTL